MGWWALVVPDPVQPRVLLRPPCLHTAHVAGLLAAYGPREPRSIHDWSWSGSAGVCCRSLAAPLAYVAVASLSGVPDQPLMWPIAVTVLLVASLTIGLRFRARDAQVPPQASRKAVDRKGS